jgi:hypothetical protein
LTELQVVGVVSQEFWVQLLFYKRVVQIVFETSKVFTCKNTFRKNVMVLIAEDSLQVVKGVLFKRDSWLFDSRVEVENRFIDLS